MTVKLIKQQVVEQGGHGWTHRQNHYWFANSKWQLYWSLLPRKRHEVHVDISNNEQYREDEFKQLIELTLLSCHPCRLVLNMEFGMDMYMGTTYPPKYKVVATFDNPRDAVLFKMSLA